MPHDVQLHPPAIGRRASRTSALLLAALLALACAVPVAAQASPRATVGVGVGAGVTAGVGEPVGGPRLTGTTPVFDVPAGVPAPPTLAAASYLLADLSTGQVLVAKAPHARELPASVLKTLTALTVIPMLSPDQQYVAQPQDLVEGSKVGLIPGSSYTVHQLLQGMLLSSGNDAATGLARAAGGVPQTVARMQDQAHALGALDTVVKDPSGLDAPGQVTSAYDLALIARAALKLPLFQQLVLTKRVRFPGAEVAGKPRRTYQIQNHDSLLYNYPGTIGVKNGYTVAARWTIIGAVRRGDRTYVLTALRRSEPSWRTLAAMFNWAFAYGAQARPIGHLVEPGELGQSAATAPGQRPALGAALAAVRGPLAAGRPSAVRTWVGTSGLVIAGLIVLVLALSAHARRRQLRAARAARSARARPR